MASPYLPVRSVRLCVLEVWDGFDGVIFPAQDPLRSDR